MIRRVVPLWVGKVARDQGVRWALPAANNTFGGSHRSGWDEGRRGMNEGEGAKREQGR